jgi:NAD(P)-dependent dehydrogenase (short-subunit alcohol dehydrogenase family)
LVTGGTSGIGLAAARRLKQEGARVAVTGTNPERLAVVEKELGVLAIQNDAGGLEAAEILAGRFRQEVGHLDGVFLNAGFGRFQPLAEVTAEEFDAEFHVNVRGPLLQVKALAPYLRDGASIVINTSIVHSKGMAGTAIYSATKGAVRALTRVLARELSPRNIRVNAVAPGPIATQFLERAGMPVDAQQGMARQLLPQVALGRYGTSEEAAAVALFLLSSDASFVTGAEYVVDGGLSEL